MGFVTKIVCNKIYVEELDYLDSMYFYGIGNGGIECLVVFGRDFDPDADEARIYITREDQISTVSLSSIEFSISHNQIEIRTSGSNFDEVRLSNPFVIELTDKIQLQESEEVPEVWSSSNRDLDAALKLFETIVRG